MNDNTPAPTQKSWPDYRAVWRWHFYASLFSIPFVIILSISGAIYLFKPQIEAWNERAFNNLTIDQPLATPAEQVRAALAAVPDSTFNAYELPATPTAAPRVIVKSNKVSVRVYVHPQTLEILGSFPDNQRLIGTIKRLHGELLLGDRGSMIVELAASWTVIMLLTGLYLWWPRQVKGLGGVLYPRLSQGSRIFWRDIHSVTGIWISGLALFLLLSGLPWAKSWGNYLKAVRQFTGTAVVKQDWTSGSESPTAKSKGDNSGEHSGHSMGSPRKKGGRDRPTPKDLTPINLIVAKVQPFSLSPPVLISAPASGSNNWTAKSNAANRPLRVTLEVDGKTGEIASREAFQDRHWIDQLVAIGIAAHEGQLFGWPNQALGLIAALGLILLSISGLILWWQRKDQGVLGAPKALLSPRVSFGLLALVLLLGIYLPLFGTSLLLVLALEWSLLRRIGPVRRWLGLSDPRLSTSL